MTRTVIISLLAATLTNVAAARGQLIGACCLPNGECQDLVEEGACQNMGGVIGGSDCAFTTCGCEGNCGGSAPACYCDDLCHGFGDCCNDVCEFCSGPEVPDCSCEGICGLQAPGGCYCDSKCFGFNDCCLDVCDQCSEDFPNDCAPCIGNTCATAEPVGDGQTDADGVAGCSASGAVDSCSIADIDRWFAYTAPCTGTATASTCTTDDIHPVTDVALSVFDACGGSELACANSHPAAECLDDASAEVSWLVIAGQTYWVRLTGTQLFGGAQIAVNFECAPGVPGACCDCDSAGQLCEITSEALCVAGGGQFHGGQECEPPLLFALETGFVDLSIPNNDATGVSHTMMVNESFRIEDLDVGVTIDHTAVGDLCVTLSHDGGPEVELIRRPWADDAIDSCEPDTVTQCFADDYDGLILDDEGSAGPIETHCQDNLSSPPNYTPNNPLSFFDGQDSAGEWTLTVRDGAPSDFGGLINWSVIFTARGPNVCVGSGLCSGCGPNAGPCCFDNDSPGCNEADCCDCICACDPFCCETEWDDSCAGQGFSGDCGASNLDGPCTAECNSCLPPPGSTCEDALAVEDGLAVIEGNTFTPSGVASSCSGAEAKDVWLSYTASCSGTATASTCGEFTAGNVAISVFSACPGDGGQEIACNDNYPDCTGGDGDPDDNATVSWTAEQGQTYLVRVSATTESSTAFFNPVFFECAPASGACCLTSYCESLIQSECAVAGGEFLGPFTNCSECVLCDLWESLAGGLTGTSGTGVRALAVYNGDLIAGGNFSFAPGAGPVNNIARWDGTMWHAMGNGTSDIVYALAVYDGELIAGGQFQSAGGQPANRIARWNGSFWQPLNNGLEGGAVRALTVYDGELIAGGLFQMAPGAGPVNGIARWDGLTWQPFDVAGNIGVSGNVLALTEYENDLIAGGQFEFAGGQTVNHIARWNGSTWQDLGGGMTGTTPTVWALTVHDGDLIAGGLSLFVDEQMIATHIARWDSVQWNPLGDGVGGQVFALDVYPPVTGDLIAGGAFSTAEGQLVQWIARFDGNAWQPFQVNGNVGMDGFVYSLGVHNQDLIAGGLFTSSGGTVTNRIARWNACPPAGFANDGTVVPGEGVFGLWQLDVNYISGQIVSGPLSFGLDELPEIVHASILLDMGMYPVLEGELDDSVVSYILTFGDGLWTQDDLVFFDLQLEAIGPNMVNVTNLMYETGPIVTPTALAGRIANFPLTIPGTDIASGEAFEYQYTESTQTLTPTTCFEVGCCQGACGGQSAFGCWCDEDCFNLGDCCSDVCAECGDEIVCPDCPADTNGDGAVNVIDLLALIASWGPCPGCATDVNDDDVVDVNDLLILLADWGSCF